MSKIKTLVYLSGLLLVGILWGCNPKVHTLYDQNQDFSAYKNFCWLNGRDFTYTGPSYLEDSLSRNKIRDAIIDVLDRKGVELNCAIPDLLIDFHISVENESSVVYHRKDESVLFESFPEEEIVNYLKGTMVIDMIDKQKGHMVWRSEAIGYMDINPDLTRRNIHRGIAKTLKEFPPKAPKALKATESK